MKHHELSPAAQARGITLSAGGLLVTPKGLVIGGAYTEPPPRQSADADDIQRALLKRTRINRLARAVGAALIAVFMRRQKL